MDPERLVVLVKKLARGAAPGTSGWTGELLLALVDDEECLAFLVSLVQDVLATDVDLG